MEALQTVRHYIAVCDLKATTDLVTPKSVQNTDLDTAWVCLSELNGNTSTFVKPDLCWFLYGKPRYLGVACTVDHRSFRGVLKNHPEPSKKRMCRWPRWQISMLLMAEILHHLGWIRPCKQWDIPPPSILNLCVFFRRCFWYLIWNVPSLRQCALLWSAWACWTGRRSLFCEWWTLFSRVCASLYLLMI